MNFALKKSVSRSGLAAALSLAVLSAVPSVAQADALAQAILKINNFTITAANPGVVSITDVDGSGEASVSLNGVGDNTGIISAPGTGNFSGQRALGVGYAPGTPITGPVATGTLTSTYAGGRVSVSGSAAAPGGANALADSTVSLVPEGRGNSFASIENSFGFDFQTGGAQLFTFNFTADKFLRAFLVGNPILSGNASANTNWQLAITSSRGQEFVWTGGLSSTGFSAGSGFTSAFALNDSVSVTRSVPSGSVPNPASSFQSGAFGASVFLDQGNYSLSISHKANSGATIAVPEPGTLALVGLSLVGLGFAGRRRVIRQAV